MIKRQGVWVVLAAAALAAACSGSRDEASGPRVVFHDDDGDLWTMDADGSERRQITDSGEGFDFDPSWSPDGDHIVFRTSRFPGATEGLMIVSADGSDERALIAEGTFPDWSPDGRRIAFSAQGRSAISIIDPDGSGSRPVGGPGVEGECSTWSPDASRIAFCRLNDVKWDVWVVNVDGSEPRQVTTAPGNNYPLGWSPDGSRIVYWTQGEGPERLSVVGVDGGDPSRLTHLQAEKEVLVEWLSDGNVIIGVDSAADGLHGYYVLRQGAEPTLTPILEPLAASCCGEGQLDWLKASR